MLERQGGYKTMEREKRQENIVAGVVGAFLGTLLGVAIMGAFILWAVRHPKDREK